MNDQLDQIAKMLRAQLKGQGHLWWIGGYVYGQTSQGDLFVILYPADERLSEKVVRVYPHDFKKLPPFVKTEGIDAGDTDANPNRTQARKRGIYHDCPLFEIVTYDGRETQMGKERRFGDVLRVTTIMPDAAAPEPQEQTAPPQPVTPPTSGPIPDDEQVVREAAARDFIPVTAALLTTDGAAVVERLKALGYEGIPGNPLARLDAYRKLKAADARQGSLLPGQPANGAFQET